MFGLGSVIPADSSANAAEKTKEAAETTAVVPTAPRVDGWEPIGFSGGGAMFSPAISGADPNLMMINCDMSGIYISRDGGRFWNMIHHRQLTSNTRCKPGFHPSKSNIIYAPDGYSGTRLKISRDTGETWNVIAEIDGRLHGEIAFDADNPSLMLAGLYDGTILSRDGGKTWTRCNGVSGAAISFHVDRTSPRDRRLFAATNEGIWRSDDGGESWVDKTSGLPGEEITHFSGGSDPRSDLVMLYCAIPGRVEDGRYTGGVYRSKDGGETWESAMTHGINKDIAPADQWAQSRVAQYTYVLTTDVKPLTVYAMNLNTGFHPPHHTTTFRSDDGGDNWRATLYMDPRFPQCNTGLDYLTASLGQSYQAPAQGAAICPTDPDLILRTASMPVLITRDGGDSWQPVHTIPAPGRKPGPGSAWICNGLVVTTTWHYYVDPFEHNRHYIAYTDIGLGRSLDRGKSWIWWNKSGRPPWVNTCYELAFDPEIPGKVWGAFSNVHDIPNDNIISGRHRAEGPGGVCLSEDFAETWKPVTQGLPLAPCTSVVIDPRTPKGSRTLYAGVFDKGVFKSTDDGKTWIAKNEGLGHPANMRVCHVILHNDGTLFSLITAKRAGEFLAEGVGLYRSKDGGESWTCLTRDLGLLWPKDFEVHPENSNIIFLGAADARARQQGGLYRTTDGGTSWKRVARFGRQHFGAYFHPTKPGWVYATMCEGRVECPLYLSTDGGDTWKPFDSFPFSNTQRVSVDPDDEDTIYVSTFGGSVFKGPASGVAE
jgi:photosystem II stability/assembly factor-like uncharacterized protein